MALTSRNQRLIAYKKLVGKSHSSAKIDDPSEPVPSSIQIGSNEIFANDPTTIDDNPKFSRPVVFDLEPIEGSSYPPGSIGNVEAEGENTVNGSHGFALKFPDSDSITGFLKDSSKRQLVPGKYGNLYNAVVKDATGAVIEPGGQYEWVLDYYSGVLFMQDLPSNQSGLPAKVEAYYYTGKYISDFSNSDENGNINADFATLDVGINQNSEPTFSNLAQESLIFRVGANAGIEGDLEVNGKLYTNELIVEKTTKVITDSQYQNNNVFGDPVNSQAEGDTHTFYGDVKISGSLEVSGFGSNRKKAIIITEDLDMNLPENEEAKNSTVILVGDITRNTPTGYYCKIDLPNLKMENPQDQASWIPIPEMNNVEYVFKLIAEQSTIANKPVVISGSVDASAGERDTIDGQENVKLYVQNESISLLSVDGNWYII